jgi:outer membrane immunogenic protein
MKRIVFAAALALTAMPALAADLPAPPRAPAPYVPVAAPIYNWSGFYIGGNVGAAFDYQGTPNNFVATGPFAGTPTGGTSHRSTGIAAGGQVGVNFQNGPWVFGVEGDADYLSNKATTFGRFSTGATNSHVFTLDLLSTVRGRIGYAFDRALFYGTGGFAMGNYSTTRTQLTGIAPFGTATPGTAETFSTLRLGWTAGGGIEYAISGNWTVRAEYLFVDLEKLTYTYPLANITQVAPNEYVHVVRAGVNFKFGGF